MEAIRRLFGGKKLFSPRIIINTKVVLFFILFYISNESKSQSVDYDEAIPNWAPSCNIGNIRDISQIDTYVNHWIGIGTYESAINTFLNCNSQVSAHFIISQSGEISQLVPINTVAYHASSPNNNLRSIGVEHEATIDNPEWWNSTELLNSSVDLACFFTDMLSIPKTHSVPGIAGHNEMPGTATNCPGNLPWDSWLSNLTTVSCECIDYNEPNNTYSEAEIIPEIGKEQNRLKTINSCIDFIEADEDWYSLGIVTHGELTITLTNPALNVEFYYSSGTQLLDSGVEDSNGNKIVNRCFAGNSCSQYFIKISAPPNQSVEPEYSLILNWNYNNGCTASRVSSINSRNTNTDLNITGDTEICEGENTTLTVTGGSGNYIWYADNNEIGTGSSVTVSNLSQGQTEVSVFDLASPCLYGSATITVNSEITANAGSDVTIQSGSNTQLQGSGGSIYSWSPNTGLSNSNIANPIASPNQTTTYTLTATENDCVDTDQVTVAVTQSSFVDLIVDDIWTIPANPEVGEDVDLYVQVKNIGTETAYSISWDYIINTNTVGSDNHYALEPNETRVEYFNNYSFSSSGSFNYCVTIDAEPNEQITSNNNYCEQITVGNSVPEDIVVTNISVSSSNLNAGDNLTVSADQYYSGGRTVNELPNIDLGYYLSSDCNFSSDDVFLAEDNSSIGSDDIFDNETEVVTIPSTTESGNYFIIFVADHNNDINESNENNNTLCHNVVINNPNSQTIDAGIVNPVNNLIIHEDNRSSYFPSGDWSDMQVDGWSNTGSISSIKLYYKNTSVNQSSFSFRNVNNPNSGSWDREIDITGGVYEVYINVRCNYVGCLQSGLDSEIRRFTYVKPYRTGNFYIPNSNEDDIRVVILTNYGVGGLNTSFYYRVYRNTSTSLSGGTYLGNWSQEEEFIDTNTEPGQTYYYWVDVAINSNGQYNSGLIQSEYRMVTTQTLGLDNESILKSINIFPNPTQKYISISSDVSVIIEDVSIFDIDGRLIKKITDNFDRISTNKLSNGIYIFSIKTSKGIISKKVIKN
jgi:hypothetical protein